MKKICSQRDSGKYLDAQKVDKEVTKQETKGNLLLRKIKKNKNFLIRMKSKIS